MISAMLSHEKFETALRTKHLTQEAFAEEIGASDRQVRNWKKKDINVSVSTCYRMARLFETSMEELLILREEDIEL